MISNLRLWLPDEKSDAGKTQQELYQRHGEPDTVEPKEQRKRKNHHKGQEHLSVYEKAGLKQRLSGIKIGHGGLGQSVHGPYRTEGRGGADDQTGGFR